MTRVMTRVQMAMQMIPRNRVRHTEKKNTEKKGNSEYWSKDVILLGYQKYFLLQIFCYESSYIKDEICQVNG